MNPLFLLWVVPAYLANGAATFSKLFPRRHPVDFGRRFSDGRRILGDGKTWEGLFLGVLVGTAVGQAIFNYFSLPFNAFLISFGALLGDMMGSFSKRRIGLKRGAEAPILDQLDFILGASMLGGASLTYTEFAVIVLATPLIHRTANIIGYLIGVKNEPW